MLLLFALLFRAWSSSAPSEGAQAVPFEGNHKGSRQQIRAGGCGLALALVGLDLLVLGVFSSQTSPMSLCQEHQPGAVLRAKAASGLWAAG